MTTAIATAQTQPDRAQLLVQVAEIRATVNRLQQIQSEQMGDRDWNDLRTIFCGIRCMARS